MKDDRHAGRDNNRSRPLVTFGRRQATRSEANGKITLDSLNRAAKALGCHVVYALVPEKPLEQMQRERAREIAESVVKPVSHSMRLEAQSIGKREEQRQKDDLAQKLLQGNPKKLWQ